MFNAAYLSHTLPYPFLNLFGDVSIPIQEDEEDEDKEDEDKEDENEDEEEVDIEL